MSRQLTHGALFNGIGGFPLAASQAGILTTWTVEKDPFCNAVSRRHFPHAHQYLDIHDVYAPTPVDIISGGYPCQPYSAAGKRRGATDDRALWPQMLRLVDALRPGWVLGENVAHHVRLGLAAVLTDLEAAGYEVWPLLIPACGVGAPHQRERVWILAHTHDRGRRDRPHQPQPVTGGGGTSYTGAAGEDAAHAHSQRCPESPGLPQPPEPLTTKRLPGPGRGPDAGAAGTGSWPLTQPPLRARADGVSSQLVRPDGGTDAAGAPADAPEPKGWARHAIKAAGNALVPQIPTRFFQFIADYEDGLSAAP
ncbi:DNA cytosine methyltransferase [Hymenobacter sp. J193]|uniref:DNA cytosine methyltransferase n=1 Tax=Hymenobacter sp. J193 TaxID=2898429 RepID=UPI0035AF6404